VAIRIDFRRICGFSYVSKSSPHKVSHELKRFEEEMARFTRIIDNKDKVISEITEDYVRLKKELGSLSGKWVD
jgi:hypothetical protein